MRLLPVAAILSVLAVVAFPSAASAATEPVCAAAACGDQGQSRAVTLKRSAADKKRRAKTSLRVHVRGGIAGKQRRVTITGPKGFKRVISRSRTFRRVASGRYTITAAPLVGNRTVTFAKHTTTRVTLRRGASGWVGVRYVQRVSNRTLVVAPDAVLSASGAEVAVNDPRGLIRVGSILTAGAGPNTPKGLLVEVVALTRDGATTAAQVKEANLRDIAPQAEVLVRPRLRLAPAAFAQASSTRALTGASRQAMGGNSRFTLPVPCSEGAATLSGSIGFAALGSVEVKWFSNLPDMLLGFATMDMVQGAQLKMESEGAATCTLNAPLLPRDVEFAPVNGTVGPVPITIVPKLNFRVTGRLDSAASFSATMQNELAASFGVGWSGLRAFPMLPDDKKGKKYEPDASFSPGKITPTGKTDLRLGVGPRLSFDLATTPGPALSADQTVTLAADPARDPWWKLDGRVGASGRFQAKAWVLTVDGSVDNILNKNYEIAKATTPPVPVFSTRSLPDAENGKAYSARVAATSARTPITYAVSSGALPTGLRLDGATGAISGTARGFGTSTFEISARDRSGGRGVREFTVKTATPPTAIATQALPVPARGRPYSAELSATGGLPPYTWSITAGSLPAGLSLSGGTISGTPTEAGASRFTLGVRAGDGGTATRAFTMTVEEIVPLAITTSALATGQVDAAYAQTLAASGGEPPYTWSSGTLPAGLALSSQGVLSGTPTVAFSGAVTVTVTDSGGRTASVTPTLTIADLEPVAITTSTLPNGKIDVAYNQTLTASGGRAPYTWVANSGLPAGLTLSSAGQITGTPSAVGTSLLSVTATDSNGRTGSRTISLEILPPGVEITTTSLPIAQQGEAYSVQLALLGGSSPYTWSITAGTLPSGLTLNTSTGVISGSTTGSGASALTFKVVGADGSEDTVDLTLTRSNVAGTWISDISCPTATLCRAIDNDGIVYTRTATGDWSGGVDSTIPDGAFNITISCPTASFCISTSRFGPSRVFTGGSWSAIPDPDDVGIIFSVDCATATSCVAAGSKTGGGRRVWVWDGTAWTGPIGTDPANSWLEVDCPTTGTCILTANGLAGTFDGSTVTSGITLVQNGENLACVSATTCFAGFAGIEEWDGMAWTPLSVSDGGQDLTAYPVACVRGTAFCATGGTGGSNPLWTWDGTAWTRYAGTGTGVTALGCASATYCVAGTSTGQARIWNGTSWSALSTFARGVATP